MKYICIHTCTIITTLCNFILIMIFNGDQYTPPPPGTFNLTTVYDVTLTNVGKIGAGKMGTRENLRKRHTSEKDIHI